MEPTLLPGDRIRVDLSAYRRRPPSLGEIVVVVDPEAPDRWLVKRVGAVREDGAHGTFLTLVSDNPGMGRDSRSFGEVAAALLVGRAYYRYGPVERRGPL